MKIGILECGHTTADVKTKHGDFTDMFHRLLAGNDFTFSAYDVENMQFPASVDECDGWLLTGSRHGAYEDHDFIPPLENFIRNAYGAHIPMVGICFGHQIIAQALGGHVEKFEKGWAIGLSEYNFADLGPLKLNAWHQDQITRLPSGAAKIASSAFCENAALIYDRRAFTIQPHPEFSNVIMNDYIKSRKGTGNYPDDLMDQAAGRLTEPESNALMAGKIADFFKQPRS